MILLDVPFPEKEQAKALGARWNPSAKKWYIPDELEAQQADFARWLPQTEQITLSPLSQDAVPANEADKGIALSQLMSQVQTLLRSGFPGAVWVKAEIASLSERRGHLYFELSETAESGQSIANCRAMIWQSQAQRILTQFQQATGSALQVGQKVLLLAEVAFHEKFGFSLAIQEIDANFTLGELEANLNKIRQQLQAEGRYQQNKRFTLPSDFFRVAVIAPPSAAGLGDFRADADLLHQAHLCDFHYFYAAFQGDLAEKELLLAFEAFLAIHKSHSFDALIIIRGGGAKLDLNPLNTYELAKMVTDAPLPVLTGIGHERDNTILDEVAAMRFDTPSKVIAAIRHTIFGSAQQAKQAWINIDHASRNYLLTQKQHLETLDHQIVQKSQQALHLWQQKILPLNHLIEQKSQQQLQAEKARLDRLQQQIEQAVTQKLALQKQELELKYRQIEQSPPNILSYHRQQIQQWMGFILSSGPQAQLQRGFALVKTTKGKPLKTAEQARQHQQITLEFIDGEVAAQINN